jgi:hypothetical protein
MAVALSGFPWQFAHSTISVDFVYSCVLTQHITIRRLSNQQIGFTSFYIVFFSMKQEILMYE